MMRQRFFEEMEAVRGGRDPWGVIRSANAAQCIELPNMTREVNTEGITLAEFDKYPLLKQRLKEFRHHYRPAGGGAPRLRRGDGDRAVVTFLTRAGIASVQVRPAGCSSMVALPPSWLAKPSSISREPKPLRSRRLHRRPASFPPGEAQAVRYRCPAPAPSRCQTSPVPLDSAPYLAALVASSCSDHRRSSRLRAATRGFPGPVMCSRCRRPAA